MSLLRSYCRDDKGTTAIEYGLVAAGIALAIIAAIQALGTAVNADFATGIPGGLK